MCDAEVIEWFIDDALDNPDDFRDKKILEVGSRYVNGGVRHLIEKICSPKEYIGVDMQEGKGVDFVVPAEESLDYFGEESFDVVITTEMLEHVQDWRLVIGNLKKIVRPEGLIFITTRSYGFPYHEFPYDQWRYSETDIKQIFSDFRIVEVKQQRSTSPGVFLKAIKPKNYKNTDLSKISLYSMATGKRTINAQSVTIKRKGMLTLCKFGLIKKVI